MQTMEVLHKIATAGINDDKKKNPTNPEKQLLHQ